eukprot:2620947-Rhodomonas_salina.1
MELSWTTLWDDDGDDDEDYDPLKDPLSKEKDDSDEEFDGLMELLSPSKKPKSSAGGGGDDSQTEQQNGDTSQEKGTPEVIGKRTRRRVHLPDEVWKDAESQLEQAERVLDPASPTDLCTDPNTQALSSQEYQRLLAVARGQAEPEDAEEDDDDEDFVPESDTEVDGGKGEEEGASQVNISRGELSDLIAENRDRAENASAKTDGAASKKRRVGRNRRSESDTAVRTISDGYAGSAGPGGFTKDQCIQLQGQMREYFQLASQQYVISCCDKDKIEERTDDIRILYEGLADLYRIWEVTTEYSKIQEKAMRILTEQIVGASENEQAAVHVRSEPRFSFFNLPGIELVPTVLQRVSDACSSDPAPAAAAAAHDHAAGQPRLIDAEAARRDSGLEEEARGRALEKAQGVLRAEAVGGGAGGGRGAGAGEHVHAGRGQPAADGAEAVRDRLEQDPLARAPDESDGAAADAVPAVRAARLRGERDQGVEVRARGGAERGRERAAAEGGAVLRRALRPDLGEDHREPDRGGAAARVHEAAGELPRAQRPHHALDPRRRRPA